MILSVIFDGVMFPDYSVILFKVMTVEDLAREMNEIIDEVAAILRIGRGHCRILLHKFNWNKESLLERYGLHFLTLLYYNTLLFERSQCLQYP